MNNIVWSDYPISRVVTRNVGLPMAFEWNFERNGEVLLVATRSAQATGEYVVASGYAGRQLRTERYTRYSEYVARILALDHRLAEQHWTHVDVRETSATRMPRTTGPGFSDTGPLVEPLEDGPRDPS